MSIPIMKREHQFERFAWVVRLSPLAVAIILASLWVAGARSVIADLRLSAPLVARPGTSVGLRAWQVEEDERGDVLILAPAVSVELRNAAGLTLAAVDLGKSLVQGREGSLPIPEGLDELLRLVAFAQIEGRTVSVERKLYVRESIDSQLPKGRAVNAFQVYALGPIRTPDSSRGAQVLDPRVEEGACVPDLRCWLSVWVGEGASGVRARPLAGVRADSSIAATANGFARIPLVVVGNEARLDVEAIAADGAMICAREVRLPIVPGGIVARASRQGARIRLDWEQLGGPEPVLIDVFQGRRWTYASSVAPDAPYLPDLGPGVWRLQARADLFSDNTAGVSYVVVTAPNGPGRVHQAADAILDEAEREGLDPLAMAVLDGAVPGAADEDLLRALFAIPSFDVVTVGPGSSSRIWDDETFEQAQDVHRWQAAAAILLIGLLVSMVLLRVELFAQARGRRLLEDLGDGSPSTGSPASSGRGLWAFVLLVFVLVAVLALSKRWF
ncbi:MAG: hypothetical protein WCE62_20360 [Polyangiales bacterium]